MKKQFYFGTLAVAGMLLAASCSDDVSYQNAVSGDEVNVTLTLDLAKEMGSRAISDGQSVNKLVYQVYDASGNEVGSQNVVDVVTTWPYTTSEITLLKGKTYTIAAWAQNGASNAYNTEDLKAISIDITGANCNDDSRDAFFGNQSFTLGSGTQTVSVILKRPFAQVNLGIDDYDEAKEMGIEITQSSIDISGGYTTLNAITGAVSDPKPITFDFASLPTEELKVTVNGEEKSYKYMAMCYVLVPSEQTNLSKLAFNLKPSTGDDEIKFTEGINTAPVQRNWRTNIVGSIFTGKIVFQIQKEPMFDGEYNYPDFESVPAGFSYDADTKTASVSTPQALKWLSDATNGVVEYNAENGIPSTNRTIDGSQKQVYFVQNIKLETGTRAGETILDMSGITDWKPIWIGGGSFDGGSQEGIVIENFTCTAEDGNSASLLDGIVSTVKNVSMRNVNISGHYKAAAITVDGYAKVSYCTVDGGTIISTPWKKNGKYDDANNVGGIAAFCQGDGTPFAIDNCTVKNVSLSAFRKVGGIVGFVANSNAKITNCSVENVTVVADMLETTYADYESQEPNAGLIAGNEANIESQITGCTKDENSSVSILKANDGALEIHTLDDLKAFAKAVNAGNSFSGKTVKLMEDIDLKNEPWTPIGTSSKRFQGKFDGNNKKISNLYISLPDNGYVGFFGATTGGEIKNLTIENADVEGLASVGVLTGTNTTPISGIKFIGNITVDGRYYVGTLGGHNCYGNYSDITIDVKPGSYVKANSIENGVHYASYAGGLIGFHGEGNYTISNITSNIDVYGSAAYVGGISGIAHYGNKFEKCTSTGNIVLTHDEDLDDAGTIGGIAGVWNSRENTETNVEFSECEFNGTLTTNQALSDEQKELLNIVGMAWHGTVNAGKLFIDGVDKTAEHVSLVAE